MKTKKISKWDAAPESFSNMHSIINKVCDNLIEYDIDHSCKKILINALSEVLDDYNKLEARHQKDTGTISEYEEENKNLKSKLDIMTDENDCLIDRVFNQDEEYNKLEADHKKLQETHDLCMKAHLYEGKTMDDLKQHYEEELRIREKEKDEKDKLINELNSRIMMLNLRIITMYSCYGLNPLDELNRKIEALEKENEEFKEKNRSLQIRINMVYGCYKSKDNALKRLCQEAAKLEKENKELKAKDNKDVAYGYFNLIASLREKIEALEKENKELKDTLNVDRELGKYIGKCVADSIQEGWKNGAYELHPYTRIDIHVEETNNMPTTFDRHAVPRIAVMFNNTQTEMERDTAQHECEELNEKVDRLWRVNDELNRKIKGLEKETNKSLSCPVACECENFKPKVHHSYDPLDDLPDMEHS